MDKKVNDKNANMVELKKVLKDLGDKYLTNKGYWVRVVKEIVDKNGNKYKRVYFECDNCGRRTIVKENYCPSCGSDMEYAVDEDNTSNKESQYEVFTCLYDYDII